MVNAHARGSKKFNFFNETSFASVFMVDEGRKSGATSSPGGRAAPGGEPVLGRQGAPWRRAWLGKNRRDVLGAPAANNDHPFDFNRIYIHARSWRGGCSRGFE